MADTAKPCTVAEIAALPEGHDFIFEERIVDGKACLVPRAADYVAIYHGPTDVIQYVDAEGTGWRLGRYADGRWVRRRM